jgi:hydrogenase maturation protease
VSMEGEHTGSFQITVLGLGNLMRTDDAVGMQTVCAIRDHGRLPKDIQIVEGGTLGLDLLDKIYGTTHLLALDAVDIGAVPGTLVRFERDELAGLPIAKSVHLLGFSDLIDVLRLMDAAPAEIVLLGVQPESTDWGTVLTPPVDAARSELVKAALKQIERWSEEIFALSPILSLIMR